MSRRLFLAVGALSFAAIAGDLNAQTNHTLTATSVALSPYDWGTPSNWDLNNVPGFSLGSGNSNDIATVHFNVGGVPSVTFSGNEYTFRTLSIIESASANSDGNFLGNTGLTNAFSLPYTQTVQRVEYLSGGRQIDFYEDVVIQDWSDGIAFEIDSTGGSTLDFGGGVAGTDGIRMMGNDTFFIRGYNMTYGAGLSNGMILSGEVGGSKNFYFDATAGPVVHDIPNLVIENSGAANIDFGRLAGTNTVTVNITNVILSTNTTSIRLGGGSTQDGTESTTVNVLGPVDFSVGTAVANRTIHLDSVYGGVVNFRSNIVVNQDFDVGRTIVWQGNGVARLFADVIHTNGSPTSLTNQLNGDKSLVVEIDAESRLGTGNVDIRNGTVLRMAYDVFGDTNGYPGSSFRYGENANTHFDFAAPQSGFFDPIANNTASGLVIRAFNGISGNLTGANFTNASGFYAGNTISFQTNAIIGENATALPTRAELGGAILYQGIQTAGGTYTNIGDDGATSIFKGVAISALAPLGNGDIPVLDDSAVNNQYLEDTFLSGFFGRLTARAGQDLEVLIPGNVLIALNAFQSNAIFNADTGVANFRGPGTLSIQRRTATGYNGDPWGGTVTNLVRIGLDGVAGPESPIAIQSQNTIIADLIGAGTVPLGKTMTVMNGQIRVRGGDNIGETTGATSATLIIGAGGSMLSDDGTGNNAGTITLNRGKIVFQDDGAIYTGTQPDRFNANQAAVFTAMEFSSNSLFIINDGSSGTAGQGAYRDLNTALYTHVLSNMNIVIGDDGMRTARVETAAAFAIGDGKRLTHAANSTGNLNRLFTISGSVTSDAPIVAVAGASNVMITATGGRTFNIGADVITTNALLTTFNSFTNRFVTVIDDSSTRSNATQNGTVNLTGPTNLFQAVLLQGGTATINGTNAVAHDIESRGMRGATAALRFFSDFNTASNALSTEGGDIWFGNNAGDISSIFGDIVIRESTNDSASVILGSGIVQVAGNLYVDNFSNTNVALGTRTRPQLSLYSDTGIVSGSVWVGPTNPGVAGSGLLRINDTDNDVTIIAGDIILNQGAADTTGTAINRGDLVVSNNIVVNAFGIDRRTIVTNDIIRTPSGNANLLQIVAYRDAITNDGVGILDRLTDGTMALGSDGIVVRPYGQVLIDFNRTNNVTYTIGEKFTIDNGGPSYKEDQAMLWMRATTNILEASGVPGSGVATVHLTNVWLNENAHLRIDEENTAVSVGLILAGTNTAIGEGTPTQAEDFDILSVQSSSPGSARTLAIGTTNSPVANDATFETLLVGVSSPDVTLDIINGQLTSRRDLGGDVQGGVIVRRNQAFLITSGPDELLNLAGSGRVIGDVSVSNILSPGDIAFNPGTLTITGDVRFFDTSVFNFDLRGDDMTVDGGVNDLLSIDGIGSDVTLDGILNVAGIGTFTNATLGDTWTVIRYGGLLTSNGIDIGAMPELAPGLAWAVDYDLANKFVNLTIVIPEPTTWVLIGIGLGLIGLASRPRR